MSLPPYLYPDLPPENVFGHSRKVECLRTSIDAFRTPERPRLRILDAGCGSGYAVTRFLPREGDEVTGLDMYAPNIDYAKHHFRNDCLRFVQADLSTSLHDEGLYDVVVLTDILEHLEDPGDILSAASSKLDHGGLLLVSIPNGYGPFEIESLISRIPLLGAGLIKLTDLTVAVFDKLIIKGAWNRLLKSVPQDLPYNIDSGHVQFFSRSAIFALFKRAGLEVTQQTNLSFICGPFTNYLLSPSQSFCRWNARIADQLPYWLVSGWFFECRKNKVRG